MRWPGAFLYMPWILEWNIEEFKIHIHCCFKNICPKNISSGRYERGQNSYPPLFKNFKVPTNGGNLSCFSYFTDSLIQVKVYLIHITKLRVYWITYLLSRKSDILLRSLLDTKIWIVHCIITRCRGRVCWVLLRKMITGTNTKKLSMHLTGPTVAGSHMEVYRFKIKFSTLEAILK